MCIYYRCSDEHGLYHVACTVDVGRTDDLHARGVDCGYFCHDGRHILIDIGRKNGLDNENVVVAFDRLHHSQVIDVTVTVKVKVGEHIGGVVKQCLELLYG